MGIYVQQDRGNFMAKLRLWGKLETFSLKTASRPQARRYYAMLEEMRYLPQGEAVLRVWWEKRKAPDGLALDLATIYQAWVATDRGMALTAIVQQANDADLQVHRATYEEMLGGGRAGGPYFRIRALKLLLGDDPFPASKLTPGAVEDWVHSLDMQSQSKLPYLSAVRKFCDWLVRRGILPDNPVRRVPSPKSKKPEIRFLEPEEIQRVIDATTDEVYRRVFLVAYGGAVEQCAFRTMRRRDVDMERRAIMVRGAVGKSQTRHRMCRIDPWAWERLEPWLKTLLPDALLFSNFSKDRARHQHTKALAACHLDDRGVTLHCCRHAWAVRKLRGEAPHYRSAPIEMVSRQLGHANATMALKVYGRWLPTMDDWDRYEALEARDIQRVAER